MTKQKSENAKSDKFKVPVDLPHVKPEDYTKDIDSAHGNAKK